MAVSPADFELYSRATGTPLPRTPQEQMRLAPQVHSFIQNRGYQRGPVQRTAGALDNVLGGIRTTALLGAGLLGAGLAASAYANKRDSEPKTPDPDANRYDKAGNVDLSDITRRREAENAEKLANRPPRQKKEKPQPYVRIPVHTKENYGTPARDLASEAENLAINITGGGSDGNVSIYDPNEGGNIEVSSDYKPVSGWGRHRGAVEKWADDVILEKRILDAGGPLAAGIVGKNLVDFGTIATGGEAMGNPATEAITEGLNRAGLSIADKDPTFRAVHGAADAISGGVQTAMDSISSWGFGPGHTIGDLTQHIAQHGSNLPGVENVGNVLEGLGQVSHNLPIEMALMGGTVAGAAALVGGARGAKKTKEVIDNAVSKGKKQLERFKRVAEGKEVTVKPIIEDHPQTNEIGPDQTRTAPSVGITDETIQDPWENEGIGLGAHIDSGNGGPKLDSLITEVRAQLGKDTTSEEVLSSLQTAIQTDGSSEEPEVAGTGTFEYPLDQALEPGNSVAVRRSELTPDMKLKAQFFDKPTKKDPTWREGKSGYEWDLATDDYMNPGESREDYSQRNKAKAKLGEFIASRMPATTEGKQSMGGLVNVVLDETSTAPNKLYNFAQKQGSSDWVRSPDGRLRRQNVVSEAGRGEREAATIDKARKFDMSEWSDDAGTPAESSETTAPSRQMSYTYPLQGNMTDEEYFNQGAFKIAKTAVDNPDFDSEAYYDNKKKWIQDQMD